LAPSRQRFLHNLFAAAVGRVLAADWHQLSDSLREPIALSPASEFALIYTHAHHLAARDLTASLGAFDVLLQLSRSLHSPTSPSAASKILYLFMLGDGPVSAWRRAGPRAYSHGFARGDVEGILSSPF
jgi:hypothetical protein